MEFGIIYDINLDTQIFSLREKRGLRYFYIPKNIFKKLKKYLYAGNYVSFIVNDTTIIKQNKEMKQVKYFKEISVPSNARRTKLYSKKDNNMELSKFLDDMNNLMFIDLEMTMPSFDSYSQSELIQASYIITDCEFNHLLKRNFRIIPTKAQHINKRTEEFLHITDEMIQSEGVKYIDFYNVFKMDIEKYNPTLVIFGKNDKSFLSSSYKLNDVEPLNSKLRFVNLLQLLKNYYELANDPGLFKTYETLYGVNLEAQKHDAYEDAYYTMKIYESFKVMVNNAK